MDISTAFPLEKPAVSIPWGIRESELKTLFSAGELRRVTNAYYTAPVRILGGLECMLGFHFRGKRSTLSELESFRMDYSDQRASFDEFQTYFEESFGSPTSTTAGSEGFPSHEWRVPGATIRHYVFDRFGPEEHMRVHHAA